MKTVIINTIDKLIKNDLYYHSFNPNGLVWIDSGISQPHDCIEKISKYPSFISIADII